MSEAAINQVGDMLAATLIAWPALVDFNIYYDKPAEDAATAGDGEVIQIFAQAHEIGPEYMDSQTLHMTTWEIEVVTRDADAGTLGRRAMNAIAEVVRCLRKSRNEVDGHPLRRLQDLQEVNVGSTEGAGKDAAGVSIQFRADFITSRDDWTTII